MDYPDARCLSEYLLQFEMNDPQLRELAPFDHVFNLETKELITEVGKWVDWHASDLPEAFVSPTHMPLVNVTELPYKRRERCIYQEHAPDECYTDKRGVIRCSHEVHFSVDPSKDLRCEYFDRHVSEPIVVWQRLSPEDQEEFKGNLKRQVAKYGPDPMPVNQRCNVILDNSNAISSLEWILRRDHIRSNQVVVRYGRKAKALSLAMVPPGTHIGNTFLGFPVISVKDELVLPYGPPTLAYRVQQWWEQGLPGTAPLFKVQEAEYEEMLRDLR